MGSGLALLASYTVLRRGRRAAGTAAAGRTGRSRSLGTFRGAVTFGMPSAPLEGKGRAGYEFLHFSAAFGAFTDRGIGKLPAQLEPVVAGAALIFVDWHMYCYLLQIFIAI